jgi:alginate O-acetyltransferase complex protein AlgJ
MKFSRSTTCILLTLIAIAFGVTANATNFPEFTVGKNGFVFEKLQAIQTWDTLRPEIAVRLDQQIEVIQAMHKILAGRGTKLVIALVPMVHRIYADQLPSQFKSPTMLPGMYRIITDRLNQLGVLTPDIERPYLDYAKRNKLQAPLFLRTDHHWSPNGGLEAARVVATAIQKRYGPELAAMPEVKYNLKFRAPKRYLEYASFFRVLPAKDQAHLQPDLIRIPELSAQTSNDLGLGLLTDTTPKITVVGTSYSSIPAFGFAASIAQHLSRDVLNAAQSGKEAWLPMGEYLASDGFQNHPPSIIVWEIPQAFMVVGMQPVHNSSDWNARQYLLELGANLKGDCAATGIAPIATHSSDYLLQGTHASSASTRATSFVKYQFANTIKSSHYLSLNASSSTSDSFVVEGEGSNPARYFAKLPGYGGLHRVNVPLATLVNSKTRSLNIRIAPGSDFSIEDPKICAMPSELATLSGTSY